MKKMFLLIFMVMVMCLTACKADKDNEQTSKETETPAFADNEPESQPQTGKAFELTDQGKAFLTQMCKKLSDFDSQTAKDETFWRDFLFYSYTDASFADSETVQVYREDLGLDETVVKVSLQEAEAYAKLVFGMELPDIKPSFDDMEEGQTSCYYQDGYYYIGVSDFPDCQYTFDDYEESDGYITVKYNISFEDESNVGTVCFVIVPEENENGFIIRSKTTVFSN